MTHGLQYLIDQYLWHLETSGKSAHTIENFGRILKRFHEFIGQSDWPPTEQALCYRAVEQYRGMLMHSTYVVSKHSGVERPYCASSVRTHIQALRGWSAYLTEAGFLEHNPLTGRRLLPKVPVGLPRRLSDDEIRQVEKSISQQSPIGARDAAIVSILEDTGIRVSEIAQLTIQDINFARNELCVHGKGSKDRRVSFGRRTGTLLRHYIDHSRNLALDDDDSSQTDNVFLCHGGHNGDGSTIGQPLTAHGIQLMLRRLGQRLGIKLTPHMFRVGFSVAFLKSNGNLPALQNLLGHTTPHMTLWYARIANDEALERQRSNSQVDQRHQRKSRIA